MSEQDDFEARLNRLLQVSTDTAIDFVFAQLTVGITSCQIAKSRPDLGLNNIKALKRAEMALRSAERFMWNLRLEYRHFEQMSALVERLRFGLGAFKGR